MSVARPGQAAETASVTLANGLRVVWQERHTTPLVAIDLWVRAGAREEGAGEAGSAHFLEHTLFKGTTTRAAGQTDRDIENLGAALNAATGPDYAHFYATVSVAHAPQALALVADVAQNATLPDAEVERERGVILDELAEHDSSPVARAVDMLYANAFPFQPYGRSPGGSGEAIRLRGRDTLAAFYRRVYQPARCVLVLAGDLNGEQARRWAQTAFGAWPAGVSSSFSTADPGRASALPPAQGDTIQHRPVYADTSGAAPAAPVLLLPSRRVVVTASVSRPALGLALPAPPASDGRMTAAATLAAEIVGGTRQGGRLDGAAFAVWEAAVHYAPRRDDSLWMVTASAGRFNQLLNKTPTGTLTSTDTKNEADVAELEQAARVEAALRNAIARLRAAPPSPLEIMAAQRRLFARLDDENETNEGLAQAIGYAAITGGDAPLAFRQRVRQTTPADIQQFVTRYLLSQPGVIVILLPANGTAGGAK